MDLFKNHAFTECEAYAEIDGEKYEISRLDVTFTVNAIPSARIKLCVGTDPLTQELAQAHKNASEVETRKEIKIYARLTGHQRKSKQDEWPDEFLIFDGFINRPSYTRDTKTAALEFYADHRITNLASISKLSSILHPRSAWDVSRNPFDSSYAGALGRAGLSGFQYQDDLWKTGMKEAFLKAAEKNWLSVPGIVEAGDDAQANGMLIEALGWMDGDSIIQAPLSLTEDITSVARMDDMFVQLLTQRLFHPRSGMSVWETLVGLASEFQYSIVASRDTATLVPHVYANTNIYKTIEAEDYAAISDRSNPQSGGIHVVGMMLFSPAEAFTLYDAQMTDRNLVGYYDLRSETDLELADGLRTMRAAPAWLDPSAYASEPAPVVFNGTGYTVKPSADNPGRVVEAKSQNITVSESLTRFGNNIAKSMYLTESLAQRQFTIAGRLRFDIGPGSSVRVGVVGNNITGYTSDYMYANVLSVTCSISAEDGKAGTSFILSHVRNKKEQDSGLAASEHPVYNGTWYGSYLCPEAQGQ